jgi:hypothetical protein
MVMTFIMDNEVVVIAASADLAKLVTRSNMEKGVEMPFSIFSRCLDSLG